MIWCTFFLGPLAELSFTCCMPACMYIDGGVDVLSELKLFLVLGCVTYRGRRLR